MSIQKKNKKKNKLELDMTLLNLISVIGSIKKYVFLELGIVSESRHQVGIGIRNKIEKKSGMVLSLISRTPGKYAGKSDNGNYEVKKEQNKKEKVFLA